MYDLELIFLTSNKRSRKVYIFNVKKNIADEYVINLMYKLCEKLDFNLADNETITPKTFKYKRKSVSSFSMDF